MAGSKEIRTKIKSVQSTRKITKAMEMVAASKMKKAQDRMRASRPYVGRMLAIARHLALANPEYRHAFLVKRPEVRNLGLMQRLKAEIASYVTHLGDRPPLEKVIGPVKVQLDLYLDGKIDELHVVSTRFENTMKQTPTEAQLLPIADLGVDAEKREYPWDYIYEPDAKAVLDELLGRYMEAIIYQAINENMASEQSARMVAMKAASDNAATIIDELQLIYNKTRQAAITKELSEIVGGAAAV